MIKPSAVRRLSSRVLKPAFREQQASCLSGAPGSEPFHAHTGPGELDLALGGHLLTAVQWLWRQLIITRPLLTQICKFLVVGGLGTLVNTGALIILYHQLHVALVMASAVATELAIGHNFLWNNYWTFGRSGLSLSRFAKFNVSSLGGQSITIITLWALVRSAEMNYIAANLVGIGLAVAWNFTISIRWTWAPAP